MQLLYTESTLWWSPSTCNCCTLSLHFGGHPVHAIVVHWVYTLVVTQYMQLLYTESTLWWSPSTCNCCTLSLHFGGHPVVTQYMQLLYTESTLWWSPCTCNCCTLSLHFGGHPVHAIVVHWVYTLGVTQYMQLLYTESTLWGSPSICNCCTLGLLFWGHPDMQLLYTESTLWGGGGGGGGQYMQLYTKSTRWWSPSICNCCTLSLHFGGITQYMQLVYTESTLAGGGGGRGCHPVYAIVVHWVYTLGGGGGHPVYAISVHWVYTGRGGGGGGGVTQYMQLLYTESTLWGSPSTCNCCTLSLHSGGHPVHATVVHWVYTLGVTQYMQLYTESDK